MKKVLAVKEWFALKKAKELNRHQYSNEIYGILKETEKAMQVVIASDSTGVYSFWCPKSQIIIEEVSDGMDETRDFSQVPRFKSYQDAVNDFNEMMENYR